MLYNRGNQERRVLYENHHHHRPAVWQRRQGDRHPRGQGAGDPLYDKELLQEAAKKSGLCEQIFESFDERPKSLLYSIAMDSYMFALPGTGVGDSLEQQVYLATFNTIRHIADQGPCVIIGRCADYALADYPTI